MRKKINDWVCDAPNIWVSTGRVMIYTAGCWTLIMGALATIGTISKLSKKTTKCVSCKGKKVSK